MSKESSADVQPETSSHIEEREKRVIEARKFNLLSNVFMRVAVQRHKRLPVCNPDFDRNPRFGREKSPPRGSCFQNHMTLFRTCCRNTTKVKSTTLKFSVPTR